MIPGSVSPLMWGQGDPLDELGKIDKSLRFRRSSTPSLTRTPSTTSSRTTWTYSAWVKLSAVLGSGIHALFVNNGDGGSYRDMLEIQGDQLRFDINSLASSFAGQIKTTALFRDYASHAHIQAVFDSTNSTGADRMRLYVNGSRILSFTAQTIPPQNSTSWTNLATVIHRIGVDPFAGSAEYLDGYLSHVSFVDGQALAPTAFGQFHPRTGQWRPKSKAAIRAAVAVGGGARNGWGTNGWFLPFDDTSSLTTLGYDRSQSDTDTTGNNWTATNISLTAGTTYDSLLDTPTNNLPVINATYAAYGTVAGNITEGGLKFASSTTYHFTPCTIPLPTKGQWVAEFIPQDTVSFIGLADIDNGSGSSAYIGGGYGWYGTTLVTGNGASAQSGLAAMAANDIITVAVDMDALSAKWYQNGVLRITQALTAGKRYAFACGDYYAPGATSCYANFGQRPFSYAPNGYKALSTKNLPVNPGGPMKSASAFVAVADTGANILSTLAAARSGWSSYIDIIKRRDAAEGWRLIFSDDPTYYLDWSGVAAKSAIPAFGGTSYGGMSLRVSAANGVATGRLAHVNGVADVVGDGLGNSRKVIILVNEAGSTWYVYHPELSAGKLLYFTTSAETTDATISSVTSSGFTVAASLPTGTYRWISMAESEGFLKLTKTVGNGAADGFSDYAGLLPAALFQKPINGAGNWSLFDNARDKQNIASGWLIPNTTSGESALAAFDLNSNGAKCRYAGGSDINTANTIYAQILIAAAPFRYANAR